MRLHILSSSRCIINDKFFSLIYSSLDIIDQLSPSCPVTPSCCFHLVCFHFHQHYQPLSTKEHNSQSLHLGAARHGDRTVLISTKEHNSLSLPLGGAKRGDELCKCAYISRVHPSLHLPFPSDSHCHGTSTSNIRRLLLASHVGLPPLASDSWNAPQAVMESPAS